MHFHNSQPTPPPSDGSDTSDQPTQVFHPSFVPKPSGILGSAASGAHYSGAKVHHRRSDVQRASGSRDPSELTESHQRIISDLSELYCCRPTAEIFRRSFREDAEFEDPLTYSKGVQEIASQWYALPKIFAKSETRASRVLSSTLHPNRIVYSQTQQYTVRFLGTKHTVKSIIIVNLDEDDKIMRLEDQWNGEEPPTAWGLATLRRLNGRLTPWLIRVPKDLRE
ncbi:uncharacterized protein FOMMEDRAFT_18137 [Fomitiporia mediterranea MF3/22]|uniref:uncharacterized protein n=1 Tax=Fomitiporia mediterranea (strain MF3/22) TaxID=694068 RepID=UPI000440759C|nr:uncharacterized protein FOMMEDRAFT_18137 [Fomitiporia mediterranea MF3/22]EJD05908.1 hypothetical protein FOMMEDRAFT_18137 [Fomitiporia mediterranea MF3/22]